MWPWTDHGSLDYRRVDILIPNLIQEFLISVWMSSPLDCSVFSILARYVYSYGSDIFLQCWACRVLSICFRLMCDLPHPYLYMTEINHATYRQDQSSGKSVAHRNEALSPYISQWRSWCLTFDNFMIFLSCVLQWFYQPKLSLYPLSCRCFSVLYKSRVGCLRHQCTLLASSALFAS